MPKFSFFGRKKGGNETAAAAFKRQKEAKELAGSYDFKCVICKKEIFDAHKFTCPACAKLLIKNDAANCPKCSMPLLPGTDLCPDCIRNNVHFTRAHTLYLYSRTLMRLVVRFKLEKAHYLSRCFAKEMAAYCVQNNIKFDALTFVPRIGGVRGQKNQSELLSYAISDILNCGAPQNLLEKRRKTSSQKDLDYSARMKNLQGAFICPNPAEVDGKDILLIDDLITTCATSSECARILFSAGAKSVCVLALARAALGEKN